MMIFPYVDRGYSCPVPIIPITLEKEDHCIVTEALVDSGASLSIFDAGLAQAVGIQDIESGNREQFEGVTGDFFFGYRHEVNLTIGGIPFLDVSIAFSRSMPDNAVNILGQRDFFSLFPIKFTFRRNEIELIAPSQ